MRIWSYKKLNEYVRAIIIWWKILYPNTLILKSYRRSMPNPGSNWTPTTMADTRRWVWSSERAKSELGFFPLAKGLYFANVLYKLNHAGGSETSTTFSSFCGSLLIVLTVRDNLQITRRRFPSQTRKILVVCYFWAPLVTEPPGLGWRRVRWQNRKTWGKLCQILWESLWMHLYA